MSSSVTSNRSEITLLLQFGPSTSYFHLNCSLYFMLHSSPLSSITQTHSNSRQFISDYYPFIALNRKHIPPKATLNGNMFLPKVATLRGHHHHQSLEFISQKHPCRFKRKVHTINLPPTTPCDMAVITRGPQNNIQSILSLDIIAHCNRCRLFRFAVLNGRSRRTGSYVEGEKRT